jgi:hypothetical protein
MNEGILTALAKGKEKKRMKEEDAALDIVISVLRVYFSCIFVLYSVVHIPFLRDQGLRRQIVAINLSSYSLQHGLNKRLW